MKTILRFIFCITLLSLQNSTLSKPDTLSERFATGKRSNVLPSESSLTTELIPNTKQPCKEIENALTLCVQKKGMSYRTCLEQEREKYLSLADSYGLTRTQCLLFETIGNKIHKDKQKELYKKIGIAIGIGICIKIIVQPVVDEYWFEYVNNQFVNALVDR